MRTAATRGRVVPLDLPFRTRNRGQEACSQPDSGWLAPESRLWSPSIGRALGIALPGWTFVMKSGGGHLSGKPRPVASAERLRRERLVGRPIVDDAAGLDNKMPGIR